jgi:hypothetical protein
MIIIVLIEELMFMTMCLSLRLMAETDSTMWPSVTMSRNSHNKDEQACHKLKER